jgi:membrane protein implicated in regulation of membrane protease activity
MGRYSLVQRIVIVLAVAPISIAAFALLHKLTDWGQPLIVVAAVLIGFVGDIVTALSMQAVAPTKVDIGPGEKSFSADSPSERAVVVSGFDDSGDGKVSIRGETWRAVHLSDISGPLTKGTTVEVVGRTGLTLEIRGKAS